MGSTVNKPLRRSDEVTLWGQEGQRHRRTIEKADHYLSVRFSRDSADGERAGQGWTKRNLTGGGMGRKQP